MSSQPHSGTIDGVSQSPIVDAYCHVGLPRFGSADDALAVLDMWGVDKAVFVLGPGVPDYATLFDAMRRHPDRVRGVGIPFGETAERIEGVVALQLRAGVIGLRVEPQTLLSYPGILTALGEQGRWLYAIGISASPELTRTLLNWLEAYPEARIAAPHFLRPQALPEADQDPIRELIGHPRFYPIFSRHGGVGSRRPYPHADLRGWVQEVIALAGWDHVLWGSEYPVYYWRDETMGTVQGWLGALLGEIASEYHAAYLGGNADRALFDPISTPTPEDLGVPPWVEAEFNRDRTVPLFPGGLSLQMRTYARLHHRYVRAKERERELTFAHFVESLLEDNV